MKICFLTSGNGGNFKFFFLAYKKNIIQDIELFVISDRECEAHKFALTHGIPSVVIEYNQQNNINLSSELIKIQPDIIVTNWYKIIDPEIVEQYKGKMINLHYSLLPAFKGLIGITPVQKAFEINSGYIGGTCHFVDNIVDEGKIISQCVLKKDGDLKSCMDTLFRQSTLILLNSILLITGSKKLIPVCDNQKFEYSPSLTFDDTVFSENFWSELSYL